MPAFLGVAAYLIGTITVLCACYYVYLSLRSPGRVVATEQSGGRQPKWSGGLLIILVFAGTTYALYEVASGILGWVPGSWALSSDDGAALPAVEVVSMVLAVIGSLALLSGLSRVASELTMLRTVLRERRNVLEILQRRFSRILYADPGDLGKRATELTEELELRVQRGEINQDYARVLHSIAEGIARCPEAVLSQERMIREEQASLRKKQDEDARKAAEREAWRGARSRSVRPSQPITGRTELPGNPTAGEQTFDMAACSATLYRLAATVGRAVEARVDSATTTPQTLNDLVAGMAGVQALPGVSLVLSYQRDPHGGVPRLYSMFPDGTEAPLTAGIWVRTTSEGLTAAFFLDYWLPVQLTEWHGLYTYGWSLLLTDDQLFDALSAREHCSPDDPGLEPILRVPAGLRVVVSSSTIEVRCLAHMPNIGVSEKTLSVDFKGRVVSRGSRVLMKSRTRTLY